jgi:hypothetical protein
MKPHRTFTRHELVAALTEVDRADLAAGIYSRRVEYSETWHAGPRCLAIDYELAGDLTAFVTIVARLMDPDAGLDFAAATDLCLPGHPAERGPSGARWLRYVLDEPTLEQWQDETSTCQACVDSLCPAHNHAPWDAPDDARPRLVPVP